MRAASLKKDWRLQQRNALLFCLYLGNVCMLLPRQFMSEKVTPPEGTPIIHPLDIAAKIA